MDVASGAILVCDLPLVDTHDIERPQYMTVTTYRLPGKCGFDYTVYGRIVSYYESRLPRCKTMLSSSLMTSFVSVHNA
jgi:hypothetical protein